MTLGRRAARHDYFLRTSLLVSVFTVVLTINFVGAMAIITGEATDTGSRLPLYVFSAAVVFVSVIVVLEAAEYDGPSVLITAVTACLLGFVFIAFGGEGVMYALTDPEAVFDSQLLIYFASAAVIATGVGYWGIRHWREFTRGAGI